MPDTVRRTIPIRPDGLEWLRGYVADNRDASSMSAVVRRSVTAYLDAHNAENARRRRRDEPDRPHRRAATSVVQDRLQGRVSVIADRGWWDRLAAAADSQRGLAQHDILANALMRLHKGELQLVVSGAGSTTGTLFDPPESSLFSEEAAR